MTIAEHIAGRPHMLTIIKLAHTIVWAVLAASIVAISTAALLDRRDWAVGLSLLVFVECGILAANRGRCPLTDLAARYTDDRADNFDIYLPLWLARHNKVVFGSLFLLSELILLWRWWVQASL
jgi:hypothetical protein